MSLWSALYGCSLDGQKAWERLYAGHACPRVLWYPSAGADHRDLLELHSARRASSGIAEGADLFVHNDYMRWQALRPGAVIYRDARSVFRTTATWPLQLADTVKRRWAVSPTEAVFADHIDAWREPVSVLTRVSIESGTLGCWEAMVLYLGFENRNLIESLFLPERVQLSHVVTVRDGSGFGGGRRDVSTLVAPLVAELGLSFILSDHQSRGWRNNFSITKLSDISPCWSGVPVSAYRVN